MNKMVLVAVFIGGFLAGVLPSTTTGFITALAIAIIVMLSLSLYEKKKH